MEDYPERAGFELLQKTKESIYILRGTSGTGVKYYRIHNRGPGTITVNKMPEPIYPGETRDVVTTLNDIVLHLISASDSEETSGWFQMLK